MELPSTSADAPPRKRFVLNTAAWFVLGLVAVGLLVWPYAHFSEWAKAEARQHLGEPPLGLSAAGFGLLAGLCLGFAARWLRIAQGAGSRVFWLAWILIAGGETACTLEVYRFGVAQIKADPLASAREAFLAAESDTDTPEIKAARKQMQADLMRDQELRRKKLSFSYFLTYRVGKPGNVPLGILFWALEIALGASVGAWAAKRMARS